MVRIVRTADGVRVDPTGKLAGRGALANALKAELTAEDRAQLEEFINTLPQDHIDPAATNK
jgi:predicted RNA-binding protein YlxR (DUF448 family)